jgi:hypothetical protein
MFLVLSLSESFASQAQNYGLGGETSGRANGVLAEISNPYAALYNPSLLAAQPFSLFSFSTGIQQTRFQAPESLKLKNQSLATWSMGFSLPFKLSHESDRQAGFGLTLSGPYKNLRTFSAYSPEDAFVMRYGASDSQFKATLGVGLELVEKTVYAGGGLSFYLSTAGAAEENIVGQNPTGRMALDVGLNSAAIVGLYAVGDKTQSALTFHQKLDPSFTQAIDGKISIAGSDVIHQPMLAKSSLYYEPQTLEIEGQHEFGDLKASVGIAYEFWGDYKAPILVTEARDNLGGTRTTQVPTVPLKNTWNPRVSLEMPISHSFTLSSGYQFRPSPVVDLSGPSHYLDSNTHVVGLSLAHPFKPNTLLPWPSRLGVYGQYHWLNSRKITKSSPSDSSPTEYTFQGNAAVYGICLQTAL